VADLANRLSPGISVGLGGEYLHARNMDQFGFMEGINYHTANSLPTLQAVIIRPGIYLTFPLGSTLSVRLDGGPALFITNFDYIRNAATTVSFESDHLSVKDIAIGIQAGISFEVNLNERIGLFLRTTGRYARAASFKGDEKIDGTVNNMDVSEPQYTGPLYFIHRGSFSSLSVHPDITSSDARSAVFDFAGLDLSLGLRIRI
jgi:hypothetical protein